MRKIEKEMLAAIESGSDWAKDNTAVSFVKSTGGSEVFLHGHHIATFDWQTQRVFVMTDTLRKWPTRTTMSRLRALGVNVYQSKNVVYLNEEAVSDVA